MAEFPSIRDESSESSESHESHESHANPNPDHDPSKHELREARKREQSEHRSIKEKEQTEKGKTKKTILWVFVVGILALVGFFGYRMIYAYEPPFTKTPVHWHVLMDIEICGEKRELPRAPPGASRAHGQAFLGIPLMHTHDDNIIHIEGQIRKREEIALGRFLDVINVRFSENEIMEKQNGDACPNGQAGSVKMFVNGRPNNEFRDYIPMPVSNARDQIVRIVFD